MHPISVFALSAVLGAAPQAGQPERIPEQQIRAERVYAPQGTDSNDIPQFIVEVILPDTSYRPKEVQAKLVRDASPNGRGVIAFKAFAYRWPQTGLAVRQPHIIVAELPHTLAEGKYDIVEYDPEGQGSVRALATLPVVMTVSERRDKFDYAPVTSAVIHRGPGSDEDGNEVHRWLTLVGTFPSGCLEFDPEPEVGRANLIRVTGQDQSVIEVLPIIRVVTDRECDPNRATPFRYRMRIPDEIKEGRYLFHIRTFDGRSLNQIEYLPKLWD